MNKYLTTLIILLALLSPTTIAYADTNPTYTISVTQDPESYIKDHNPVRQRTPSRPVICTITPDGINIPSISTENILSYDVYDTKGACIESFSSKQDFLSFIFSINGTVEIRFHIEGYVIHGWISL